MEGNALKRPEPLSESYTANNHKSHNFCKFKYPAFFEPVSAVLLLLETAVIDPGWVIIQLEDVLTPLFATVLQFM